MSLEGREGTEGTRIPADSSKGRLLRFLFCPTALGSFSARHGGFAARLARSPMDLVTHIGMERANAYYAAGCPAELCEDTAARDLWRVIYRDAIEDRVPTPLRANGYQGVLLKTEETAGACQHWKGGL